MADRSIGLEVVLYLKSCLALHKFSLISQIIANHQKIIVYSLQDNHISTKLPSPAARLKGTNKCFEHNFEEWFSIRNGFFADLSSNKNK